jgi:uncharacterized membrane protein SirB2
VIEFYPQLRAVHIACVIASGTLFLLRGLLMLVGSAWSNHVAVRMLSYTIDTTLLTAALMLMAALGIHPGNQSWLAVKLALLVVYIVLGVFALRRARTRSGRLLCFVAALAVLLYMVGVARAHSPWGWFAMA